MPNPIAILIDFNVEDRLKSVSPLIHRLSLSKKAAAGTEVVVDLSKCRYLGPDGAALLAAAILTWRGADCKVRVALPEHPRLAGYSRIVGLEALASGTALPAWDRFEGEPVLPLTQVERARFQTPEPVIQMVGHFVESGFENDVEDSLRMCVNEVVQNIEDHSESAIGGVMTARYMSKSREVRVAIVDTGVGICHTLSRRFPDTTPENALQRVLFEGNYSSLSRENNLGLGLSNLAATIMRLDGSMFIVSEESAAEIRKGGDRRFARPGSRFQGTGVFFTLPVES